MPISPSHWTSSVEWYESVETSALFGAIGFFGWYYRVPEYVLTYAFLATFAAHCVFMQYWKEVFVLLKIQIKRAPQVPARELVKP